MDPQLNRRRLPPPQKVLHPPSHSNFPLLSSAQQIARLWNLRQGRTTSSSPLQAYAGHTNVAEKLQLNSTRKTCGTISSGVHYLRLLRCREYLDQFDTSPYQEVSAARIDSEPCWGCPLLGRAENGWEPAGFGAGHPSNLLAGQSWAGRPKSFGPSPQSIPSSFVLLFGGTLAGRQDLDK